MGPRCAVAAQTADRAKATRKGVQEMRLGILWREADAAHQILEARVGVQRVKSRINFEIDQVSCVHLICLLQPSERVVFFSQPCFDEGHVHR